MNTPERIKIVTEYSGSLNSNTDLDLWGPTDASSFGGHFLGFQTKTSGTGFAQGMIFHPQQSLDLRTLQVSRDLLTWKFSPLDVDSLIRRTSELLMQSDLVVGSLENVSLPELEAAPNDFQVWLPQATLGRGQLCLEIPSPEDVTGANTALIRSKIDESRDIYQIVKCLCEAAKEETFESGVESNFSRELFSLISEYSNIAIDVLSNLIITNDIEEEIASEVLLSLGRVDHLATYSFRLWLLEKSLTLSSFMVRDSAALGLAYLDDPHSIPYLKAAIEREEYEEIRKVMKKVLAQLEKTRLASYTSKNKQI